MYIPSGKQGYFNILAEFVNGDACWGMDVHFLEDGTGILNADIEKTFSFEHNSWFTITVYIALDLDEASLWLNDDGDIQEIHRWKWTDGYTGLNVSIPQLAAIDFYGIDESYCFYIDDFRMIE